MKQFMIDWLVTNSQYIGFIFGFIFIFLEIKENAWLWPVGILTAIFSIIVLYQSKVYADMGLQVYYFVVSIYGWILWVSKKGNGDKKDAVSIKRTSKKQYLVLSLVSIVLYFFIYVILKEFTDSPIPGWDSLTTSLSIVATWMLAHKLIEQWWIWIFVNIVTVFLYFYRSIDLFAVLFIIYTVMAVVGYVQWNKTLKAKTE